MRIRRIALRNFKGVAAADVPLAPEGVTVIEGPNEVGKSSLAEAIDLLFEEPDGSTKQRVKAVKPVAADVGAEVEVELSVGPYEAVYRKRWHKQPQTTLRVVAPRAEHYTGRRAHDRMNEILDGHIDRALWKALRYQQGVGIAQAAMGDSLSLLTALDAAAAGKGLGDEGEAEDLWSRVGAERERYFTPTGRPNAARVRLEEQVEAVREKTARLRRELTELEAAAEDHHRLQLELVRIAGRVGEQERIVADRSLEWSRLRSQQQEVDRLAVEAERAGNLAEKAGAAHQKRRGLIEQLQAAGKALSGLADEARLRAPELEKATTALAESRQLREKARQALRSAELSAELAGRDFEYFRELFNLEMLAERLARVQEAERRQGEALAFLESCTIDAAKLDEIEHAFLAAATAGAGLRAESASVRVEALAATDLEVDGRERSLASGEVVEAAVSGSLEIVVPGRVRIGVIGGARTQELEQAAADAEQHLQALYAAAGISGDGALEAARELERRRRSTAQTAEQAARALQENLRDLTPQGLAEMIDRARSRTGAHLAERPAGSPMPSNRDEAQAESETAAALLLDCRRAVEQRDGELEVAEQALRQVQDAAREREFRTQAAEQARRAVEQELTTERQPAGDEELVAALGDARLAADAAEIAHRDAAAALSALNPEQAAALLENAREVLEGMKQSRRDTELQLARVEGLLELRGEAGLHDQLDAALSERHRLEREKEHTDGRAAAAQLLYRTLAERRDAAKRTYVAPFREQLEGFGRIVFGADLSIELDHEDLRVVSRTLDGVTVPYASLSTGAKEQLSLIARLAGAVLVSRPGTTDGGVPVIIDDALGNSDPARLERLGAVLSLAGRHVQVIVLTCVPDRYANVGSATVVRLAAGGGGAEAEPSAPGPGPSIAEPPGDVPADMGEDEGSWAALVLGCLEEAGAPLGKAEIISRCGLPEGLWPGVVASLVAGGQVLREGEKRGSRYRLPPG